MDLAVDVGVDDVQDPGSCTNSECPGITDMSLFGPSASNGDARESSTDVSQRLLEREDGGRDLVGPTVAGSDFATMEGKERDREGGTARDGKPAR